MENIFMIIRNQFAFSATGFSCSWAVIVLVLLFSVVKNKIKAKRG